MRTRHKKIFKGVLGQASLLAATKKARCPVL